jgi:aryl-alcohol dehydrogenase-like predicted oxidoreductase
MITSEHTISAISKITLGTVQLGMDYGVANRNGKPDKEVSINLLKKALETGTVSLDTARHYGSEEVISASGVAHRFTVVTKFKIDKACLSDPQLALQEARKSVLMSCTALGLKKLQVCLFHQDKNYPIEVVADVLPRILQQLKEEGLIERGGISVYYPAELHAINDWHNIDAVQVPMNVFDLRLLKDGLLDTLKAEGVAVFIRSVFLQGLLLMDPRSLPPHLTEAAKYIIQLNTLASAEGISAAQLAFSYVRDTDGVASLVIGAENVDQIMQNAALLNGPGLSSQTRSTIETLFSEIPEELITPGLWSV